MNAVAVLQVPSSRVLITRGPVCPPSPPPLTAPAFRFHPSHERLWRRLMGQEVGVARVAYRCLRLAWTHEQYVRACRELDELLASESTGGATHTEEICT